MFNDETINDSLKFILDTKEYKNMTDEEKKVVLTDLEKTERFINLIEEIYYDIYPEKIEKLKDKELGRIESFQLNILYEDGIRVLQSSTVNINKKHLCLLKELENITKYRLITKLTNIRDFRGIKIE